MLNNDLSKGPGRQVAQRMISPMLLVSEIDLNILYCKVVKKPKDTYEINKLRKCWHAVRLTY